MIRFFQFGFYFLAYIPLRVFFERKLSGLENIPSAEKYILAANHGSKIDPFLLCLLPFSSIKNVFPCSFPTAEIHYNKYYIRPFIFLLGAYRMKRWAFNLDEYTRESLRKLKNTNLLIFPEGQITQNELFIPAKPGISYIMKKSNAKIVPLYISIQKRNIRMSFGHPLTTEELLKTKGNDRQIAQVILEKIYHLSQSKREIKRKLP